MVQIKQVILIKWIVWLGLGIFIAQYVDAVEYRQVDTDKSQISFLAKQMGVTFEGDFKKFSAKLVFDSVHPEQAQAIIEIDLASIDVGSDEVYQEVINKNWFNVKQFPIARFVSTLVQPIAGGQYLVKGQLTIKNKTREITAVFTPQLQGTQMVFAGNFRLKRLDYGIGIGSWGDPSVVADEVEVKFRLLATH